MLIRSQNKKDIYSLENMECIYIDDANDVIISFPNLAHIIGKYSTKEQALKVLNQIENEYLRTTNCYGLHVPPKVFHMPEDNKI